MTSTCQYQVLSIDDSRAVHAFLDRCLQEVGGGEFMFLHALNVHQGLEIMAQPDSKVAAVILDWEMPEVSGLEGLKLILSRFPKIPVIMFTTKNDPADIGVMLAHGAADYMMKPITADILIDKLKSISARFVTCCQTTN